MSTKLWIQLPVLAAFCLSSSCVLAQDLGRFKVGPSKGEVIAAAVGAAAVVGLVVYLVIPKHKTIEGCVVSGDGGLQLTTGKNKRIYALDANTLNLQPGQHVTLKGKLGKKHSGTREFAVNKLVKDEGTCAEHTALPMLRPETQTALLPAPKVFSRRRE